LPCVLLRTDGEFGQFNMYEGKWEPVPNSRSGSQRYNMDLGMTDIKAPLYEQVARLTRFLGAYATPICWAPTLLLSAASFALLISSASRPSAGHCGPAEGLQRPRI